MIQSHEFNWKCIHRELLYDMQADKLHRSNLGQLATVYSYSEHS